MHLPIKHRRTPSSTGILATLLAAALSTVPLGNAEEIKTAPQAFNPELVYKQTCVSCHGNGASGAPILGDKDAWKERVANGMDALLESTVYGLNGTMPPKGLCFNCSEEQLRAVVQYMIDQSQ